MIQGNSKAFATVAGIIDGTGSIGAALGPFIAGALYGSEEGKDEGHNSQLDNVFYALMVSNVISILVSVNKYMISKNNEDHDLFKYFIKLPIIISSIIFYSVWQD